MSQVENAMAQLIDAFHKYSGKEGDNTTLTKGELKELLQNEMKCTATALNKSAMDKIFSDLDTNHDNTVDFKEYMNFITCVTMICNDVFNPHQCQSK